MRRSRRVFRTARDRFDSVGVFLIRGVFPNAAFQKWGCFQKNGVLTRSGRALSGQPALCGKWLSFALLGGGFDSSCVVPYLDLYSYSLGGQSGHFSVGLSGDMRKGFIARFLTLTNGT